MTAIVGPRRLRESDVSHASKQRILGHRNNNRIMLQQIIYYLKLVLIFIYDLILRVEKYIKFIVSGKHEFQRICESPCDIYEKTMRLDQWLTRTHCERIRDFWDKNLCYPSINPTGSSSLSQKTVERLLADYTTTNVRNNSIVNKVKSNAAAGYRDRLVNLEDADKPLANLLDDLTNLFVKLIKRVKRVKLDKEDEEILREMIYRIVCYRVSLMVALRIAGIKYDSSIPSHTLKLLSLWNNLIRADKEKVSMAKDVPPAFPSELQQEITRESSVVSSRWSHVGFQGEDPGTDFRGMGLLGLEQLEYLSRRPRHLARDLLKRSLNEQHEYPFAITGINVTYNLVNLYKDGSMKHLYYDYGDIVFRNKHRHLNLITTLNDLYVELYLRFDCYWHESKPENIFAFRELMENFVKIIKLDLESRNFSMKFIY